MTITALTTAEPRLPTTHDSIRKIITLVLDALNSENSRRAYERALMDFIDWWADQGRPAFSKAVVQRYKTELQGEGLAPSTINQHLSAIRKLAREASDNGLLDPVLAQGIARIKGVSMHGRRTGNWLTVKQAQALINAPDIDTLKGLRDRAILTVLIGCGLRRSEAARLSFSHVQQREGRWAVVDLVGKGNRVRTVPMPSWAKAAIDEWVHAAGMVNGRVDDMVETGRVFRRVHKGGYINGDSMTSQAIADVVKEHAEACDLNGLAPHDLRRTFAKLAHKGGAGLDQIQLSLGHASIKTTERYLGVEQNLHDAPCDRLGLQL